MYLQLHNLCKSFYHRQIIQDLSINLEKGQILCLLGSSGCGKTTVLRMISGLLPCDCGKVIIDNIDVTSLPSELRPVSTVFQSYALFPNLTVLGNVTYGLRLKKIPKKEAEKTAMEYLEIAKLTEYAHAKIYEISGGQQQRVALMRSLIVKPKLLLLDEPLSNLDAKFRVQMRSELKELRDRFHLTMIFVTHDREEAMAVGDQIAVMNNGKIEQSGTAQHLYFQPKNIFVAEFLGKINTFKDKENNIHILRPEDLIFSEKGSIYGKVIKHDFYGHYNEYAVQIPEGVLTIFSENSKIYSIGESVHIAMKKHIGNLVLQSQESEGKYDY